MGLFDSFSTPGSENIFILADRMDESKRDHSFDRGACAPRVSIVNLLSSRRPSTLQSVAERRQVPRYISELHAQILQPATGSRFSVQLVTLSVRGCCVAGAGVLNHHEKCKLSIEWEGQQVLAEVEVVWKHKEGRVGLKFLSVREEDLNVLREVCTSLPLQPLNPPREESE